MQYHSSNSPVSFSREDGLEYPEDFSPGCLLHGRGVPFLASLDGRLTVDDPIVRHVQLASLLIPEDFPVTNRIGRW